MQHLISLRDIGVDDLTHLVDRAVEHASSPPPCHTPLKDKVVGIYFRKPSTRTRTSFTVGALRLGASTVSYGPDDLQATTGETLIDTARVLSAYMQVLVVRTNESIDEMRLLAAQDEMAIVNALSEHEHPTQAISDLATIKEHFGHLDGIHVLYVGEGNSTAAALALALAKTPGTEMTLITPARYGLDDLVVEEAARLGTQSGSAVRQRHTLDLQDLPRADVVYTTRWQTLGVPRANEGWREEFAPFTVTLELMDRVRKDSGTVFMHDLPCVRGEEAHAAVLDGPDSLIWRQAQHKMFAASAILEWCTQ